MSTKLTLTIEKAVIEKAKAYAKSTGRSLSELVESQLEKLIESETTDSVSPGLKKIIGSVRLPSDFDEQKELQSYYEEKYQQE